LQKLIRIDDKSFLKNNIQNVDLSNNINIQQIGTLAFCDNNITYIDLSKCNKLTLIGEHAFANNPIKEIKILENKILLYNKKYKHERWNQFAIYYNKTGKRAGDYKLENDEWKWYPL